MAKQLKGEKNLYKYIQAQLTDMDVAGFGYQTVMQMLERISRELQKSRREVQEKIRVYDGYRIGEQKESMKLIGDIGNFTGYVLYKEEEAERVWLDKKNRQVYINKYKPQII